MLKVWQRIIYEIRATWFHPGWLNAAETALPEQTSERYVCMYVGLYIYSPDMDIQKYTVTMKIIVNSVKISSPIGTISNSEVVDLQ